MKSQKDLWSAYRYGQNIKIVYHTCGRHPDARKPAKTRAQASSETDASTRFEQSVSRTRAAIFELAMCNDFEWFVTMTLDSEKRDRNDLQAFRRDFAQFVRDQNKKRSQEQKIEYLLIPEQHKDGAWHMHGLFKGLREGTDLVRNEHRYLDWPGYRKRFGFFSCDRIRSQEACSKYITKYVTKDIDQSTALDSGAHAYYASQGLKRREALVTLCADRCPIAELPRGNGKYGQWDFENEYVKICWLRPASDGLIQFPDENGELTFFRLTNGG